MFKKTTPLIVLIAISCSSFVTVATLAAQEADSIYRNGAITFLRGSMNFAVFADAPNKPPGILLKVTAFDLDNDKHNLAPLDYAYLSSQGISYAGKESGVFEAEDGGLVVGYDAMSNPSLDLMNPLDINILSMDWKSK